MNATLRDRLDRKLADLFATADELRAIMEEAASHSDADLVIRQSPRLRCPSCGGQTGSYDGQGQWWPCAVCDGTGYRTSDHEPEMSCCGGQGCPSCIPAYQNGARYRGEVPR